MSVSKEVFPHQSAKDIFCHPLEKQECHLDDISLLDGKINLC